MTEKGGDRASSRVPAHPIAPRRLLEELARPAAFPHATGEVQVIQTHISIVFLAGPYAYKVKKPVDQGFLDYTTLGRRRWFCHEEVRLNRRLAPSVYHGVVPVTDEPGGLRFHDFFDEYAERVSAPDHNGDREGRVESAGREAGSPAVEWAVRMTRLPEHRTLEALLSDGEPIDGFLDHLAHLLADFHRRAERGPKIATFGSFRVVRGNAEENFAALEDAVGFTVGRAVLRRLRELSNKALLPLRPLIERRAQEGVPCDAHGDLRLGHVYAPEEGESDLTVVDCIEFNERFRCSDPVADIAFLVMELEFEDRPDLGRAFAARYFEASGDPEGAELLSWYVSYRDVVRGKVRTIEAGDDGIAPVAQDHAAGLAVRHFLRALGRLAPPLERPCIILVAGLPGVGKSVLSRRMAEEGGFTWIDTDRIRKSLAGAGAEGAAEASGRRPRADFDHGIYTPEWTERTYSKCLREATEIVFDGGRVLVEGSFRTERYRTMFLEAARAHGVPLLMMHCEADRETIRQRLEAREQDVSDADWSIYQEAERRWQAAGPEITSVLRRVRTDRGKTETSRIARETLVKEGLL